MPTNTQKTWDSKPREAVVECLRGLMEEEDTWPIYRDAYGCLLEGLEAVPFRDLEKNDLLTIMSDKPARAVAEQLPRETNDTAETMVDFLWNEVFASF